MTMVKWDVVGLDDMIDEVIRVTGHPDFRVTRGLHETLELAFIDTQEKTHVISGSLKASGKVSSEYTRLTRTWEGTIEYGGEHVRPAVPSGVHSPSAMRPKNPVDYAIYEKARGGEHDFFRDLAGFENLYMEAILSHFHGDG